MTYKELMFASLTALLHKDEILMYPIYGILKKGNEQRYAFFGFTKTHFLVVLLAGKNVYDTMRIPLDIKSVSIKKTLLFRESIINIAFNNGKSFHITAAPRVLMIDSQKENLPRFLEYLNSVSIGKCAPKLKTIHGDKIRWQYFNTFILLMLSFVPAMIAVVLTVEIREGGLLFSVSEFISTLFVVGGAFLSPFIFLSILNRFLFGKIVSVCNYEGFYLENGFIPWENIKKVVYTPELPSKTKTNYTFATLFIKQPHGSEYTIDILHFPLYGLRKMKKYQPNIKIEFTKNSLFFMSFLVIVSVVAAIVIALCS